MTSRSKWHYSMLALIMLCAALAYAPALQGPLLFDDLTSLTLNPVLQIDGWTFDGWRTAAFSSDAGPLHRPIAMLSFAANNAASGDIAPLSLKLVNLIIHLLIAALVYCLALSIFRTPVFSSWKPDRVKLSALAAMAIWVLHPLHVSTVLYAVQRMAQLSTLFTVLGLTVFMRYRLAWAVEGATTGAILAAALWLLLIMGAATLSKENGALLPWLLAVFEVCLFRGQWRGLRSHSVFFLGWAGLLLPLVLMVLILLVSPEIFTSGYVLRDFTMVERLLTQLRVLWQYLDWLVLPDIRSMGIYHDDIAVSRSIFLPWTTLASLIAWIAVAVMAFAVRRRFPLLLFALLFFLVGQTMESSVLALEVVFEHRNYLPGVGVCILMGGLLSSLGIAGKKNRPWLPVATALGVLLVLLIIRAQIWSGQLSLAHSNVANHPSSPRAHYSYADALMERHKERINKGLNETERDREENKSLIVAARKHFLRMHEEQPGGAMALVKLMYLDSYYFPGLQYQANWFGLLQEVLKDRVLQASDLSAVSALVSCVGSGGCYLQVGEVEALLDGLILRYPGEVRFLLSKYQLLSTVDSDLALRVSTLEKAAVIAPNNPSIQQHLVIEAGRQGDVAGMYEIVGNWLAHDPRRWNISTMTPLFSISRSPGAQTAVRDIPPNE